MTKTQIYLVAYRYLRAAGLTHEATLGMMGNWEKESLFDAFRKQGDLSEAAVPSHNYVAAVTSGAISREQFSSDDIGFGLAQWTYWNKSTKKGRKLSLYDFWKRSGKALDDPVMQVEFAVWELENEPEFSSVYTELKKSDNLFYCTDLICKRYEKPQVNNVNDRYDAARKIGAILASKEVQQQIEEEEQPEKPDEPTTPFWPPRVLCFGMVGSDVALLQSLLTAHDYNTEGYSGVFDVRTKNMLMAFQGENGLVIDGVAGPKSFKKLGVVW